MSNEYTPIGTIVWFFKDLSDVDIPFNTADPFAATVVAVHSPQLGDVRIMTSNTTSVVRTNVPLANPNNRPVRPYALLERICEDE